MQAGKYYVGDLCYVLSDKDWSDVCRLTIADDKTLQGEFNLPDGRRFAIFGTAYGDGEYSDQLGNDYFVDSGTLGCILYDSISADKYDDISELGAIITFDNEFDVEEDHGQISFGYLTIETNDNDWNDLEEDIFDDWSER